MTTSPKKSNKKVTAGLFVTCLIDAMRPSAGMAALRLLEAAGCEVIVPENQTCCGQPAWNSGDIKAARVAATPFLDAFDACDYVVVPSGSCAGMLAHHLVDLFEGSGDLHARRQAAAIAGKTYELTSFLVDVMGMKTPPGKTTARIAYHDSCSSLREMKVISQPRALLNAAGADVVDLDKADTCCGFGGTFSVKYGDISGTMADDKATDIEAKDPDMLVAGDMGCLMNIAGRLLRRGSAIEVRHVAEVLDGAMEASPIGGLRDSASQNPGN
ncbi:(Fe-S)-binding protein [Alphaproteobacteria bacterium LSUCC0684]